MLDSGDWSRWLTPHLSKLSGLTAVILGEMNIDDIYNSSFWTSHRLYDINCQSILPKKFQAVLLSSLILACLLFKARRNDQSVNGILVAFLTLHVTCTAIISYAPADDYEVMLRQQGFYQSRETFSSLFTGLSCLQNLKLLDLRKIAMLEGSFWQPLAQLQSLETLYVIIDELRAENFEAVSRLSALLHIMPAFMNRFFLTLDLHVN